VPLVGGTVAVMSENEQWCRQHDRPFAVCAAHGYEHGTPGVSALEAENARLRTGRDRLVEMASGYAVAAGGRPSRENEQELHQEIVRLTWELMEARTAARVLYAQAPEVTRRHLDAIEDWPWLNVDEASS
jgi:hypothetical protein